MGRPHNVHAVPSNPGPARAARTAPRDIWYSRCPVPTALGLAVRLGVLQTELGKLGAVVHSLQQTVDRRLQQSHFTHSLADSIRHGGNTPAIFARSEGAATRAVALSWTDTPHPILTLPGSGIQRVEDLKGRRLALARRTNEVIDFWRAAALRAFEVALRTAGLTLDDVTLVDLPVDRGFFDERGLPAGRAEIPQRLARGGGLQREEVFALIRGDVDAIYSQSSFGTELINFLGARVVYDVGRHPDPLARANNALPEVLTISQSLIDEAPELVATLLAHVLKAAEWAKAHRPETIRIIAAEQGVSEAVLDQTYGQSLNWELDVDLSDFRVAALRARKEFLLNRGFIRSDFDLDGWIDPRPLAWARQLLAEQTLPEPSFPGPLSEPPAVALSA